MARHKRFVFVSCLLITLNIVFTILSVRSNAANSIQETTANSKESTLHCFDVLLVKTGLPNTGNGQIESVTVSNDGYILLAFNEGNTMHHIELYSDKCDILYHLVVKDAGATVATFDNESNFVLLYSLRGKKALRIDRGGNYVCEDAAEFNFKEIDYSDTSFSKTIGDKTYKYINNILNKSLTVTLSDGTILFQRKANNNTLRWLIVVGSLIVLLCSVGFCKYGYCQSKAKRFK